MKRKSILVLCSLLVLVACNAATNYQLWTTAGQLADTWLNVYSAGWADRAQFDKDWAIAGQDILNFTPGSSCQTVQQAVTDALGILATVNPGTPTQAAILSTAIVGAEVVEAYFVKCAPATSALAAAMPKYKEPLLSAVLAARKTPPKDAAMLKKQWKQVGGPPVK